MTSDILTLSREQHTTDLSAEALAQADYDAEIERLVEDIVSLAEVYRSLRQGRGRGVGGLNPSSLDMYEVSPKFEKGN